MLTPNVLAVDAALTLAPYSGPWDRLQAGHLLRRTMFAPTKLEIDECITLGMAASLDRLFEDVALPDPPVYFDFDNHPDAGIGDPWIDLALSEEFRNDDNNSRNRSLQAWMIKVGEDTPWNIRERMVIFWHNHFGMGGNGFRRKQVRFLNKYRTFATGNFRDLVKEMAIDPYMLHFLNGNTNTRNNPNENFAREILELFTIGKGEQVAVGDYTNYTEQDVTELARAFTGWRTYNMNTTIPGEEGYAEYQQNRHDTGTKTLSHRFDNQVIQNAEELEYANVVDIIFGQEEVAHYICRKLYRHFVYFDITADVETTIIGPMAQTLIDNDYVIEPALRQLLSSQHFYLNAFIGGMIKSPIDLTHSIMRPAKFSQQATTSDSYNALRRSYFHADNTGMELLLPPSVAGWTAWYQSPSFHRQWLNTVTIQEHTRFARRTTVTAFYWGGERFDLDWLSFVDTFGDPFDPTGLIEEMVDNLLARPLGQSQIDYLKDLLLGGLEDYVWTNEYVDYQSNPNDEDLINSLTRRLNDMLFGMFQLAEFYVY